MTIILRVHFSAISGMMYFSVSLFLEILFGRPDVCVSKPPDNVFGYNGLKEAEHVTDTAMYKSNSNSNHRIRSQFRHRG